MLLHLLSTPSSLPISSDFRFSSPASAFSSSSLLFFSGEAARRAPPDFFFFSPSFQFVLRSKTERRRARRERKGERRERARKPNPKFDVRKTLFSIIRANLIFFFPSQDFGSSIREPLNNMVMASLAFPFRNFSLFFHCPRGILSFSFHVFRSYLSHT